MVEENILLYKSTLTWVLSIVLKGHIDQLRS
jgi:hypothetical protein